MATTKRFVAKNGLDNNGQSITNLGIAGSTLTMTAAHSLSITTSGTTTITVPSGTVTLLASTGLTSGYFVYASGTGTIASMDILRENASGQNTYSPLTNQGDDWGKENFSWRRVWSNEFRWRSLATPMRFDANITFGANTENFEWLRNGTWQMRLRGDSLLTLNNGQIGVDGNPITTLWGQTSYWNDGEMIRPKLRDFSEALDAKGSVSGNQTANFETANNVSATATGDITWSVTNPPASGSVGTMTFKITASGGTRTMNWPLSFKWGTNGAPPAISSGQILLVSAYTDDGGTSYLATWAGGY